MADMTQSSRIMMIDRLKSVILESDQLLLQILSIYCIKNKVNNLLLQIKKYNNQSSYLVKCTKTGFQNLFFHTQKKNLSLLQLHFLLTPETMLHRLPACGRRVKYITASQYL
jgi:hypothetical protein